MKSTAFITRIKKKDEEDEEDGEKLAFVADRHCTNTVISIRTCFIGYYNIWMDIWMDV